MGKMTVVWYNTRKAKEDCVMGCRLFFIDFLMGCFLNKDFTAVLGLRHNF